MWWNPPVRSRDAEDELPDRDPNDREQVLAFGPFQLFRARKMLLENGRPVRLGSRAIDLLTALVERAGEVVGKNELIAQVWPNTIVEDNNLRVHITSIRKRLGEGQAGARYIVNVAGRGYSFIAPVSRITAVDPGVSSAMTSRSNLPAPISRPVGRADTLNILEALVKARRLVTIVGPGGIGKSTVALSVAELVAEAFDHRVFFADLAVASDAALGAAAVASALGISVLTGDPIGSLVANLRDARMLIVLDNCEHVIAEAAEMALRILRGTPGVTLMTTSREPLLVDGEQVYQLAALTTPAESETLSAAQALEYSAVQLFVERAINGSDNFALTDANAGAVATLCRRLDGVPLAIEIVAARAGLVGLNALDLATGHTQILEVAGRRTASSRHSSLGAALTWSYRQLSSVEQAVLRRLSVFTGWFSAAAAVAVVSGEQVNSANALEALMSLAAKSLLSTDVSEQEFRYRLLHVTRVYSATLLTESGDAPMTSRRHAEYYRCFLESAIRDYVTLTRARWLALHQSSIDDIRAALEWAFGVGRDEKLGATLTVAAVTFGFQLSLIDEFKKRTEVALAAARRLAVPVPDLEVRLTLALTNIYMRTAESVDAIGATMDRVVALTKESGVAQNIIWPLSNRSLIPLDFGDYHGALDALAELEEAAKREDDPFAALTADRVGAMVFHWSGYHSRARGLAERVLRHPAHTIPLVYSPISVDRRVSMRMVLSRILWLEGLPDQARDLAAEALELAAGDSPNAVCDVLGHAAAPIAFWRGDLQAAAAMTDMLLDQSRRYTLTRWYIAALCFKTVLALRTGVDANGLDDELQRAAPLPGLQRDLLATMSHRWLDATTVERGARHLAGWCSPEVLRATGEMHLSKGAAEADSLAESAFVESLRLAREQQALGWELRSASSLARLWRGQGRREEAEAVLSPVYERFREGAQTADLVAARSILE